MDDYLTMENLRDIYETTRADICMRENQHTIGHWADNTFGEGTAKSRSLRLLQEVVELCCAAGATPEEIDAAVGSKFPPEDPAKVPEELADCNIVLKTIAHTAFCDLDRETDAKMAVNRARKWKLTGGGCGQHE